MKKVILFICSLFLLTGCTVKLNEDYTVDISNSKSCDSEIKEYYSTDEQKIYTACIDKITLKDDKNKIELNKYLKQKDVNLDETISNIIDKVVGDASLLDGSTIVYQDGGTVRYTKNGYTIIDCNTTSGNNDVYIATDELKMEENSIVGFCGN